MYFISTYSSSVVVVVGGGVHRSARVIIRADSSLYSVYFEIVSDFTLLGHIKLFV